MIDIIYRYDPGTAIPPVPPTTPAEARQRLQKGNREFVTLLEPVITTGHSTRIVPFDPRDIGVGDSSGRAPRQRPFAAVLGCSDARVPTEMIFSEACNALFVVRVAGNVLGNECLGSLDYALANLAESLKLVVVLGHSGCGALTAAVDAFLNPTNYLSVASSHPLRAIVDRLFVAVRAAAQSLERVRGPEVSHAPGYRLALVEMSVALNAALTAKTLRQEFRDISEERTQVVYSVYDLASRELKLPIDGGADQKGLFDPPVDANAFGRLGMIIAGCTEVTRLLHPT